MTKDEFYMGKALEEAKTAFAVGEIPIGAVIIYQKKAIARAYNLRESLPCATAHAELLAIEKACRDFSTASVDAVRALWPTLDAFAGQRVRAQLPVGASLTGRTVGLAAHGELLLEDDEGRVHRLTDARVRPLDNE